MPSAQQQGLRPLTGAGQAGLARPRPAGGSKRGTGRLTGTAAEASAEITRAVIGTAVAATTEAANIARQATEAVVDQVAGAGQAAVDIADRLVSSVTDPQRRSGQPTGEGSGGASRREDDEGQKGQG